MFKPYRPWLKEVSSFIRRGDFVYEFQVTDVVMDTIPVGDLKNDSIARRWFVLQLERYL